MFKIEKKNVVTFKNGGTYNLNEDNHIEAAVVKLHLLELVVAHQIEALCCNGEPSGIEFQAVEKLSEIVWSKFKPVIEKGYTELPADFLDQGMIELYGQREIVNGFANASPMETNTGLPVGWWWDYPGFCKKYFDQLGEVSIGLDTEIIIEITAFADIDNGGKPYLSFSEPQLHILKAELRDEFRAVCSYLHTHNGGVK